MSTTEILIQKGDTFRTFEDFEKVLKSRSDHTNEKWKTGCKNSVAWTNPRLPEGQQRRLDLLYASVTFKCKHGGTFKSRGSNRRSTSMKIGCGAFIKLRHDRVRDVLVVYEVCLDHNHPIASREDGFYPEDRKLTPEEAERALALLTDRDVSIHELTKELSLEFGKPLKTRDLYNLKRDYNERMSSQPVKKETSNKDVNERLKQDSSGKPVKGKDLYNLKRDLKEKNKRLNENAERPPENDQIWAVKVLEKLKQGGSSHEVSYQQVEGAAIEDIQVKQEIISEEIEDPELGTIQIAIHGFNGSEHTYAHSPLREEEVSCTQEGQVPKKRQATDESPIQHAKRSRDDSHSFDDRIETLVYGSPQQEVQLALKSFDPDKGPPRCYNITDPNKLLITERSKPLPAKERRRRNRGVSTQDDEDSLVSRLIIEEKKETSERKKEEEQSFPAAFAKFMESGLREVKKEYLPSALQELQSVLLKYMFKD